MADQAEVEQSAQERMEALLSDGLLDEQEEEVVQEAEEAEIQTEDAEAETEGDDSEEETAPPGKLKLIRNGEEIEVDLEEAKNLAQQGYDYTQKTQKLAEDRKQVEAYVQALKAQEQNLIQQAEMQQAYIKEIAKVESLNEQIAQFEGADWNAISDADPVQAQKLWIRYQQLQNDRAKAANEIQQKHTQIQQQRELQAQARLEEARAELLKAIPDWNEDTAKGIRESGKAYGFTDQELSGIVDPRMVRVLADVTAYRKLQASKGAVTQKVQGKPAVVKPGTKDVQAVNRSRNAEARQQLRKTGDQNIAAKLIEAML